MSVVVGINCAFHESSAAIVVDGVSKSAVAEERFNRIKKGKRININNPHELPFKSIEFCLSNEGLKYEDVDYWAISIDPKLRLNKNSNWDKTDISKFVKDKEKIYSSDDFGSKKGELTFFNNLLKIPDILRRKGAKISTENNPNFFWLPHHLCHAASSFYPSGFEDSAILVLDAGGEYESAWFAHGNGNRIKKISGVEFPNSLGFLWIKISQLCGLGYYGSGKLMGLASWGDPKIYRDKMQKLIKIKNLGFKTNEERIVAATNVFGGIEDLFNIRRNNSQLSLEHKDFKKYANIAASLQEVTEKTVLALIKNLKKSTNTKNLCLAGGIFLNCHVNQKILDSNTFKRIYICPASTDDGTAVGAALEISARLNELNKKAKVSWLSGPKYSDGEINTTLKKTNLNYNKSKDIIKDTAKLLNENHVVAWFQGLAEFGPRALGNRSILANPLENNKKRLNSRSIKDRENFRPVCPSSTEEDYSNYFSIAKEEQGHEFMLFTTNLKKDFVEKFPGISHPGNTARLQIVKKESNKKFHTLLEEFGKLSGHEVLINTSLNSRGEPIVNSPLDAVRTFNKCKGIDFLAIGNYLVSRKNDENKKAR